LGAAGALSVLGAVGVGVASAAWLNCGYTAAVLKVSIRAAAAPRKNGARWEEIFIQ
jgi:hypothetical protein